MDQESLRNTCNYILSLSSKRKDDWAERWALFFLGCNPLLGGRKINDSLMREAFNPTKNPVVGIFVLRMLEKHNPRLRQELEEAYNVNIEMLREKCCAPIIQFSFLEDMAIQFSPQ